MEHISSRQNALVKRLRALAANRGTADDVFLDGPHLVEEALASGADVTLVAVASDAAAGTQASLVARALASGVRIVTLPPALLDATAPVKSSSGIVAIARLRLTPLETLLASAPQLLLVLDRVQDPGNVGAIVRAAEACGASGIIVSPGTADPFGWKALRGSMGSAFRVPVATAPCDPTLFDALSTAGLRVLATVPRDGTDIRRADLVTPAAVVLGGEGEGLAAEVIEAADERITIPMRRPVESLNVAVAAALIVYEASRQRNDVALR